jgi:tetratricopeptide (TPR) repeat protein
MYYDVITAEPSNPWIAGIANLYTREFYQVINSKLKDDGIFAQWFHNYSMSPDDFRMVFRTFSEAFPHVTLWGMKESDFLLIGSKQPQNFDYAAVKAIYDQNPMLRSDLDYLGLSDPYAVQGFYRMGHQSMLEFSKGADINTDDGAELEFSAPKNLRRPTTTLNQRLMAPFLADGAPWLESERPAGVSEAMHHYYLAESYAASVSQSRALKELAEAIRLDPNNPDFYLLQAKVLLEQDKSAEGAAAMTKALDLNKSVVARVLGLSDELYLPEAKQIYGKVIGMGSREILPYLGLGNIALHSDDIGEAAKWFARARELEPEHPAVLLALGRLSAAQAKAEKDSEAAQKMFEEARRLLERAKLKGEESPTLFAELGEVYSRLAVWDQAASAYEQALRMRRRRNDWRLALGNAYGQLGRISDAELKYRQVLALSPDEAQAARALESLGRRF